MWLLYYDLSCYTSLQYLLVATLLEYRAAAPQFA